MRHRLSFLMPSPAMAIAVAALVAACCGLAVAASSSSPVIRACANKKTGALRLNTKCRRSERRISWSQTGPQGSTGARGPAGLTGATGAAGPQGKEGPQGPGAIGFDTSVAEEATLAGPINGIVVRAFCKPIAKEVDLQVAVATSSNHLQASGVASVNKVLEGIDSTGGFSVEKHSPTSADFDVVAADSTIGKTVHVDVHGDFAEPECHVWGIAIPAS
jgi:hypothetical protein